MDITSSTDATPPLGMYMCVYTKHTSTITCNLCLYLLSLQLVTFLLLSSYLPVQVKSYARVSNQRNENDKGYVSIFIGSIFYLDRITNWIL